MLHPSRLLFHPAAGKGCHQFVHFLFAADIVGLVQNVLLLGFGQVCVAVHSGSVCGQCQTEPNGNVIEIHSFLLSHCGRAMPAPTVLSVDIVGATIGRPLGCRVQHVFNKNAISGGRIVNKDMSNGAYQFSVLYNR